ncbi:MAG: hypothetical protein IIZ40_03490 [Bacilli bacterium]|nr:hypothetical protein [Bacilli bacterium]
MTYTIISIIIISIIGTISHFLYDISNHNKFIGLFSAVNESTWEHIKIALTPTFFWCIIDGILFGQNPNYFLAKLTSLVIIIVLMPLLFYGYQLITKKDVVLFDILIFYIVIISSQLGFYFIINMSPIKYIYNYLSCLFIFLIFSGYLIHTTMPAKSFLFKDPITKKYGFKGHVEYNKDTNKR